MDSSINIKPVSECYGLEGLHDEPVLSLNERCGNKLKKVKRLQECDIAGALLVLLPLPERPDVELTPRSLPSKSRIAELATPGMVRIVIKKEAADGLTTQTKHPDAGLTLSTVCSKVRKDVLASNKPITRIAENLISPRHTKPVEEIHVSARLLQGLAAADISLLNVGKHSISQLNESPDADLPVSEVETIPSGQLRSGRDEFFLVPQDVVQPIHSHESLPTRLMPSTEAITQQKIIHATAEQATTEKMENSGDSLQAEMTWHFKSWGDHNRHTAKLVFADLSAGSEVSVIPSNETVRSALIKQQPDEGLSTLLIQQVASQDGRRDKNSRQHHDDEEGEA